MSLAKKCDICGKFYEHYETEVEDVNVNAIIFVKTNEECNWGTRRDAMDCCPDCLKSIIHYIDGLRNGAGQESKVNMKGERE